MADSIARIDNSNDSTHDVKASNGNTYLTSKTAGDGNLSHRTFFYFYERQFLSFATDGTSNTIICSEACAGDYFDARVVSSACYYAGFDNGDWTYNPSLCMNQRSAEDPTVYGTTVVQHPRCGNWLDRLPILTAFATILPPNSPSCFKYNQEQGQVSIISCSSYHSGGVNAGMLDGSVRFISDTVDTNGLPTVASGIHLTGKSKLGVWGAMGTPNGGESLSL